MRQSGLAGHEKRAEEVDRGYRAYFEHNRAYDGYLIAQNKRTNSKTDLFAHLFGQFVNCIQHIIIV